MHLCFLLYDEPICYLMDGPNGMLKILKLKFIPEEFKDELYAE
jgi:hypothetical protein